MTAAAMRAEFVDLRLLQGRGVVRLTFEAPKEQADAFLELFGGVPKGQWVGMALLADNATEAAPVPVTLRPAKAPAGREPRTWGNLTFAQQAGILCGNPDFIAWCGAADDHEAAEYIRRRCGVPSRAQLDRDPVAADVWMNLSRAFFTREDAASQEAAYRRTAP